MNLSELQYKLRQFAQARDWEQFHRPRSLVLALTGEVGELAEIFQWMVDDEPTAVMAVSARGEAISSEIADVMSYLLRLADVLGIDVEQAIVDKIGVNEERYPVHLARGSAAKHDALDAPTPTQ